MTEQVLFLSLIGNPVKIGDGPAAVIGDKGCRVSLADRPGRRNRRLIRKSEDLPGHIGDATTWTTSRHDDVSSLYYGVCCAMTRYPWIKRDIPDQFQIDPGFFLEDSMYHYWRVKQDLSCLEESSFSQGVHIRTTTKLLIRRS
jgi:hypothetical protein